MDLFMGLQSDIIFLLLVLNLKIHHCKEPKGSFVPLNLKIYNDLSRQRLFLEWNVSDPAYESGLEIIFHIQVSRAEKNIIIWNENYSTIPSKTNKTMRWSWDSDMPLECVSHSVRIRSAVAGNNFTRNKKWSMWSPWKTNSGVDTFDNVQPLVYPVDKIVNKGSNVSFCCIAGKNQKVLHMSYNGIPYPASYTNNRTFVITVKNVSMTNSRGTNVFCKLSSNPSRGTVLFVSKAPDEPKNISCQTQDIKTLTCVWSPGEKSSLSGVRSPKYTLYEWFSQKSSSCSRDSCIWSIERNQQIYNFTLTAENHLGKRAVNIVVDVTQRVHPLAPTDLVANHLSATHVLLNWSLKANYTVLLLLCQIELHRSYRFLELRNTTIKGETSSSLYSVSLDQLQPYTNYTLRIQCMEASYLQRWSKWSEKLMIRTQEAVPTAALDIWREVNKHLPAFHANGNIVFYDVTWQRLDDISETQSNTYPALQNSTQIIIGRQAYLISITARNAAGSSPPSEIRIPAIAENQIENIKEERIYGKDGGIYISWQPVPSAFHGYIVDWCNFPRSQHCDFQWKKFNSSINGDVIKSSAFTPGVRYDFRIYGSKKDGEYLLEERTGYIKELASSVKTPVKIIKIEPDALTMTWDPHRKDESQRGFISGYYVYLKTSEGICDLKESAEHIPLGQSTVCRFSIPNPEEKSFTINQLRPNTKYEVAVVSVTGGGESAVEFSKADTSSDTRAVILVIVLSVIIFSIMALMLLIMGYWKRKWLKDLCYPDIPDPHKSRVLSLGVLKGNADSHVMTPSRCIVQNLETVNMQELEKLQVCEKLENVKDHQSDLSNGGLDRDIKTICCHLRDDVHSGTSPSHMEHARDVNPAYENLHEALYQPQPHTYLEFFNTNYCNTPEYKPQIEVPHKRFQFNDLHNSSIPLASMGYKTEADLIWSIVTSEDLPSFDDGAMSPTSLSSAAFLLKD
ncbi:hypothetical protein FKM82_000168 [Ascaphus truei]